MLADESVRHVRDTFKAGPIPTNVKASRFLGRHRFLRRFSRSVLGSPIFSPEGHFFYKIGASTKKICFDGRNLQFRAIYDSHYKYGYEVETGALIAHLCRGSGAFWDVGSNWGIFPLLAASLPEFSGPIVAFEPNPRTFKDLFGIVQQAGLGERIDARNIGLGASPCVMTIGKSDEFETGLSHLTMTGSGSKVDVTTLDTFASKPPSLIKIDAEGMELDVLRGGNRLLADSKPIVIFENFLDYSNPSNTLAPIEFLSQCGYRIFIPILTFDQGNYSMTASYGSDYASLFNLDSSPRLGVLELHRDARFLYAQQLNLVAFHEKRLAEVSHLLEQSATPIA